MLVVFEGMHTSERVKRFIDQYIRVKVLVLDMVMECHGGHYLG